MTNISWKNLFTPKYIFPLLYLPLILTFYIMGMCMKDSLCSPSEYIQFTIGLVFTIVSLPAILISEIFQLGDPYNYGITGYLFLLFICLGFYLLIGLLLEIAFHKIKKRKASNSTNSTNK